MAHTADSLAAGIGCITFDLDDTLWACAPVIEQAERLLHGWLARRCSGFARRYDLDAFVAARGRHWQANPQWHHDMTALRKDFLRQLLAECGCDDALAGPAFGVFIEARNAVCLHRGAEATLQRLGRHFRLGVVTNGNADVHRIGIGHLFDFVVTTAEVGRPKPDAAVYRAVVERAALPAGHILHVGDDPVRDVLGAAAVGMKTAWVNAEGRAWTHPEGRPDLELQGVDELPALLGVEGAT